MKITKILFTDYNRALIQILGELYNITRCYIESSSTQNYKESIVIASLNVSILSILIIPLGRRFMKTLYFRAKVDVSEIEA